MDDLNGPLIRAVEYLKTQKVIKKDAEIVERTGFSKAVVSNYLSNRVKASKNFLDKFSEVFNIDLSDFKTSTTKPPISMDENSKDQIALLKQLLAEKDKRLADKDEALLFARSVADGAMKALQEAQAQLTRRLDEVAERLKSVQGEFDPIDLDLQASREFFAMQFARLQKRKPAELLEEYGIVEVDVHKRAGK